jgi:DNA-binding MarR family transcriptional regulator
MTPTTTNTALSTVLDLALARTVVVRDVDAVLGSYHGLGLNDLALLMELRAAPNGRLRRLDLAERLGITPSGVARQLVPLEHMRVVGRESHPGDARLALVVLTEAGARLVDEAVPTAEEAATRVLGKLWNGDEQERASALLQRARS